MTPVVSVFSLRKHFKREDNSTVPAIDSISLDVNAGEVLALLGPSGCGKTTLLRAIAGLERPDFGTIIVKGKSAFDRAKGIDLPPEARHIGMIFQSYALWPHMSAAENVAYPLKSRGFAGAEIPGLVGEALRLVGIGELAGQYPAQLSGGQQQRVALARAIVARDDLILFDEPLSNVDAKVRQQLRFELLEMQRRLGFSAVYVTHDQIEAMALAHRIAVLNKGKIEQLGTPQEIYDRPVSRYVANFVGTTNEIEGRATGKSGDGKIEVDTRLGRLTALSTVTTISAGDEVCVLFRPENCVVSSDPSAATMKWKGTVEHSVFLGPYTENIVKVEAMTIQVWMAGARTLERGAAVWVEPDPRHLRLVPAKS